MRALSESAELKECPPRAPLFGSRTLISLFGLLNWAVCGYPLPSTLSRQSAYLGSTHLLASLSDPPSPHPLRRNSTCDKPADCCSRRSPVPSHLLLRRFST